MKIYFLSSKPCALTLNGVFYGVTNDFERFAEITLSDNVYAQFSPEGALPVGFFITENLPANPPEGCELYLLPDAIAVYAKDFPPRDHTLRLIAQHREGDLLATVFAQGLLYWTVETEGGLFNATLPPSFSSCSITYHHGCLFLEGDKTLAVFNRKAQPLLIERVNGFSVSDDSLRATLPLSDSLGRTADCTWLLTDGQCLLRDFSVRQATTWQKLPDGLLAYAFLESVLLKADYASFLSDELQADQARIVEFLGDFCSVTLTKEPNVCGLVRKKQDRLFVVEYVEIESDEGKIVDVRG